MVCKKRTLINYEYHNSGVFRRKLKALNLNNAIQFKVVKKNPNTFSATRKLHLVIAYTESQNSE